jgi:hypothetical protein
MSLGLDKPTLEPKETRIKKTPATKKRNLETSTDDHESKKPPAKAQRVESDPTSASGVRRSSRNVGRTVDYVNEVVKDSPTPISFSSGVKTSGNLGPLGRQTGQRKYNPLVFLFTYINVSLLTPAIARHMDLFQELKLALGGKPGRAVVLTQFMRMHTFGFKTIILIFCKSMGGRYIWWT